MRKIILAIFAVSFALVYRAFANEQLALYALVFLLVGTMYIEGHLRNLKENLINNKTRIAVFSLAVIVSLFITNLNPPLTLGLIIFLFLVLFKVETDTAIQYAAYIFISIPVAFIMRAMPFAELLTTTLFLLLLQITLIYIVNLLITHAKAIR